MNVSPYNSNFPSQQLRFGQRKRITCFLCKSLRDPYQCPFLSLCHDALLWSQLWRMWNRGWIPWGVISFLTLEIVLTIIPSVLSVEAGGREVRGRTPARSSLSEHNGRTWSRRFSPNRGDYLKVEDEVRENVSYLCLTTCLRCPQSTEAARRFRLSGRLPTMSLLLF